MAKDRKCILCETVYVSRQEMEDHMRSMLHHRELEKVKGRDCGHECRVCKVTVASLTDYASHISSPAHKQNVEAFERKPARNGLDEDYFDHALVELIEKRNEQIRKDKEAAAAKLVQEEEERKKKEEFQQRLKETKERFRLECSWSQQGSWYKGNQYGTNPGNMQNFRPWHQSKSGKSATWHAQDPPNFKNFNKVRPPWISSAGSSNGVYGCNNISQYSQHVRPPSLLGPPPPFFPSLPKFFTQGVNQCKNQANEQGVKQKAQPKNVEKPITQADDQNNKSNKTFGSNPKLDKTCRWSPYHVNKGSESMPNLVEKNSSTHKTHKLEKSNESRASRSEKSNSSGKSSNNSSRSSSLQREGQKNTATPSPSSQRANKPAQQTERRSSLGADISVNKVSSQTNEKSSSRNSLSGLSKSERQLPETLKKVRQLEKRRSLDSLSNTEPKTVDNPKQSGVNKENSIRQNRTRPSLPDFSKPFVTEKDKLPSTDQTLQHLQVSTSSMGRSTSAMPNPEGEENKKQIETETFVDKMEELVQGSESDTPKTAETTSQATPGLSKLDLPPVLKRDLTKHISSKAKTSTSHEPNLNIARRVRNFSESKRSDSEKDSGLKPTVRQLISSSGSRRNVNWEQVYHEVKKKQDKGKGMPRFGIEMVPIDHEDHSQEEDDLPLLQGFHWESLMDSPPPPASRKRSLSESSIAPVPSHAPFLKDLANKSETQGSSPVYSQQDSDLQQDMEIGLDLCEVEDTQPKVVKERSNSIVGESSSGTELCDGQGSRKKRRASKEVPQTTLSLEHHTKRRKIKSKKERLNIDQLLAVSLREEELSRSLQTLDTDLIKARAALEAAYMEVQRLMMVKQQMSTEMGTLRNKRIELLKGMQDSAEGAPECADVKQEKLDKVDDLAFTVASSADSSAPHCGTSPVHSAPRASPPVTYVPFTPAAVKEEPQSPVHLSSELDTAVCAHSTTPELPTAASVPDATLHSPPSTERRYTDPERDEFGDPVDSKESLAELVQSMERGIQASRGHAEPNSSDRVLGASWRNFEVGFVESTGPASFETPSVPSGFNMPASPSELRNGKRVRKLKKRKWLKKAQGSELPESSDTEMDTEASRPRWLRPRRRNSGSPVSASNQQTEDREETVKKEDEEGEDPQPPRHSAKQSHVVPSHDKVKSDLERSTEHAPLSCGPAQNPPESSKTEAQNVACYEISSTSDMDISPAVESDVQVTLTPKHGKISSDVYSDHGEDELPTEGAFEGHVEAVNAMKIHNGLLYTCSGDRTVRVFDIVTHKCVAVFEGHSSKVNAVLLSTSPSLHHRLYTGSSDQTIRSYSLTTQKFEQQFSLSDRVLCLHSRWKILYAGLGNGTVVTFNLKTNRQMDVFECHGPRAVSCLASSQEGARRLLLVGSYDNTISVRDAKNGLLLRTLEGHSKTVLCMKVVNDLVFSGSSDQCVYSHNIHSGQLVRIYKGHSHAVSVVSVLGKVMVTACLDKLVRVYDLQAHEQLQVYGGHKDMVMCMTIHKNMIYTGCYDGSVQAVKLNLMQNYHCRWHGCSLVFGVFEHLEHHLTHDHTIPNLQTHRCRWKNCEEFFSARISSKQAMLLHMQKHAEEESQVEP